MNYLRKTLASAAAAALVSAAVSMNRYRINQFLHSGQRQRHIQKLRAEYQDRLEAIRRQAQVNASVFATLRRSHFFQLAEEQGLNAAQMEAGFHDFQEWAWQTLYRAQAPRVALAFAKELYVLDPKQADEINVESQDDLVDAKESCERMRAQGFPVDELLKTLEHQ